MLKLSSLLLVFFAISVQADPWIQEEGEWNFRLEHVINKFDTIRVFDDSKAEIGTIKGNTTSLSISYGLMKDLELGVRGSYISSNRENDGDNRNNTLSDAAISLKYRLLNEFENSPFTLSLGAEYQSPLRSYEAHKLYSGGDGQNDLAFSISVGKFIELNEEWALFASADLGYNFRFQGSPDEINLAASVGLTYRDWSFYTFIDKTDARDGLGIGSPEFGAQIASDGRPPFPEVEEDHVLGGVGVAYNLTEHTSVEVTVAKKLSYSNSSKDTQIGFALNFNF